MEIKHLHYSEFYREYPGCSLMSIELKNKSLVELEQIVAQLNKSIADLAAEKPDSEVISSYINSHCLDGYSNDYSIIVSFEETNVIWNIEFKREYYRNYFSWQLSYSKMVPTPNGYETLCIPYLERIKERALQMIEHLQGDEPTYFLAIQNGVKDWDRKDCHGCRIDDYEGEAVITMANGKKYHAIGHRTTGKGGILYTEGYIEFIELKDGEEI